jgi:transcriptional regulator with XRE-family HTH domain
VPSIKAKTSVKRPAAAPEREDHRAFVAAIGRLVRLARAKRGMTRRQLAHASGASERYLAQIEGGAGNPSVIMLASIAHALDVPIIELLPRSNGRSAAMAQILDVLARTPRAELPALAELIESRAGRDAGIDRGPPDALVGLRGAGKSTLGRRLADALGCPFIELDRLVEQGLRSAHSRSHRNGGHRNLSPLRARLPRARDRRAPGGRDRHRRRHRVESRNLCAAFAPHAHGVGQGAA